MQKAVDMKCAEALPSVAKGNAGQSLVESCIVIALIGLVFMGIFQVSMIFSSREILNHAAARGARARTVGFNHWMVSKAVRVAAIPNAGRMVEPAYVQEDPVLRSVLASPGPAGRTWDRLLHTVPSSRQYSIERARIPEYLGAHNSMRARWVLDYDRWDAVRWQGDASVRMIHIQSEQRLPLTAPMSRTFYADDHIELTGEAYIENHYSLYLDDQSW